MCLPNFEAHHHQEQQEHEDVMQLPPVDGKRQRDVAYRLFDVSDVPRLQVLHKECFDEDVGPQLYMNPYSSGIVAEVVDAPVSITANTVALPPKMVVIGFAVGIVRYVPGAIASIPIGHVNSLAVDASFRKLGVGRKLLELFGQLMLQKHNIRTISLNCIASADDIVRFYERSGFVIADRIERYYRIEGAYLDANLMVQNLDVLQAELNAQQDEVNEKKTKEQQEQVGNPNPPLRCPNGHSMEIVHWKPLLYVGWYCDICTSKIPNEIEPGATAAHCPSCNYDLCPQCVEEVGDESVLSLPTAPVKLGEANQQGEDPCDVYLLPTESIVVCPAGHEMKWYHDKPPHYSARGDWVCDECNSLIAPRGGAVHCQRCSFDKCVACLRERIRLKCPQKHVLVTIDGKPRDYNGWGCDYCNKGIPRETRGVAHCSQCKYDLCPACSEMIIRCGK